MSKVLNDMKFAGVKDNLSGIRSLSFLALKSSITGYPTYPGDDAATAAAKVTMEGDFAMADGKTFIEMYTRKGTGKVGYTPDGPEDAKSFLNKAELDYPDIDDDSSALASDILNDDVVVVTGIRVANSSKFKFVIIGNEMNACKSTPEGDSGTLDGNDKKTAFSFECRDKIALPRYVGTIKTATGTWDCADGTFTPTPAG